MFNMNSDFNNINTRNKLKIAVAKFRLAKTNKSFLGNGVRFYNELPKSVADLTVNNFRKHVKSVLLGKAYYRVKDYVDYREVWS